MHHQKMAAQLHSGLALLGVPLGEPAISRLLAYCALLAKWNSRFNLTAIRDDSQLVSHHLLDSLAVVNSIPPGRIIDVGSGAGLPGIPLAVALPERHFTLLDSNGKKTRFLVQVVGELGMDNVAVVNQRAEDFAPAVAFDAVISRAFSSLSEMLSSCQHLLSDTGVFLAMKGKYPEAELLQMPKEYQLLTSTRLHVPGLNADRHLLMLGRS